MHFLNSKLLVIFAEKRLLLVGLSNSLGLTVYSFFTTDHKAVKFFFGAQCLPVVWPTSLLFGPRSIKVVRFG